MINVKSPNFLEELIYQYTKLPTNNREYLDFGLENLTAYLNANAGKVHEKYWRIYFDFLFFLNNYNKFEKAAELYTKVLKKSPPNWRETKEEEFSGMNNVMKITNINHISKAKVLDFIESAKTKYSKLDFSATHFQSEENNESSIELLRFLFHSIRGLKCQILGEVNLISFLEQEIKKNHVHQETFLLLLEIYQCVGYREKYEELALDYIDKFEESVLDYNKKYVLVNENDNDNVLDEKEFCLSEKVDKSEIIQLEQWLFNKLQKQEGQQHFDLIQIDCKNTKIIDFTALEYLAKSINNNSSVFKDKNIVFKNLAQIVYSSMEILGVDKHIVKLKLIKY